jgi:hypothetical protein
MTRIEGLLETVFSVGSSPTSTRWRELAAVQLSEVVSESVQLSAVQLKVNLCRED